MTLELVAYWLNLFLMAGLSLMVGFWLGVFVSDKDWRLSPAVVTVLVTVLAIALAVLYHYMLQFPT